MQLALTAPPLQYRSRCHVTMNATAAITCISQVPSAAALHESDELCIMMVCDAGIRTHGLTHA